MENMIHAGKLIRKVLDEQGRTVVWFAKQLSYTRTNVYKIFEKKSIDTDVLFRISRLLQYDFFKHFSNDVEKNND